MNETILQITKFLENNELEAALKKLHSIFALAGSELADDAIMLSAQFKKLRSDVRKGILDYSQETLQHNRIAHSTLSLLEELKTAPDRFQEFFNVDDQMDKAAKDKFKAVLPIPEKDALFERLSRAKEKNLDFHAVWIDDSPGFNKYESAILDSIGVKIDHAANSHEAYQLIKKNNYRLILSDISREDNQTEGLDFHKKLLREDIDLPVIFYTSYVDRSLGVPPHAFGIAHLPNELLHLVMDVVERG
jgi:hypothetical protein